MSGSRPIALGDADPSLLVSLGALFIVILAASLGQGLFQYVGARIRDRITWQPARAIDAIGGAALSAAAVLVVAWALGVAISGSRIGGITGPVRSSTVLGQVNEVMPEARRPVPRRVQRRGRHDVLPALPRAVLTGADRGGQPR